MNINSISNTNFKARISENDYNMEKIEEDLFCNHGIGAEEVDEFQRKLESLPAGNIVIDEYIKHANSDYVFGTIYPPCGHEKPFVVETSDSENLLEYILEKIKRTFDGKSKHSECPICNPKTNTL